LGISGISNFYPFIDVKNCEVAETEFPEVDMQDMPFEDGIFDFVISDQVLEHLENPKGAIALYKQAIRSNPRGALDLEAHYGIAQSWRELGNQPQEISALETLLDKYDFNRYGWPAWYPTRTLEEWEQARSAWGPYVSRSPTDKIPRPQSVHSKKKKRKK